MSARAVVLALMHCNSLGTRLGTALSCMAIETRKVGGYVSKRKRGIACTEERSPVDPAVCERVRAYLRTGDGGQAGGGQTIGDGGQRGECMIPVKRGRVGNCASKAVLCSFTEHYKPVLSLEWHPTDPRLLLSSSLDGSVRLWDASPQGRSCVATWTSLHSGPIWDAVWVTGNCILTGGADMMARYTDVETGQKTLEFKHRGIVTVTRRHPDSHVVLTGDSSAHIQSWDLRTDGRKPAAEYTGAGGEILDIETLRSNSEFVASSSVVRRNSANQALSVWDIKSTVTLSNQIYPEPYTCPRLRAHPTDKTFLAQSNGNYVVMFSSDRPYRLNKHKRFEGHAVEGFAVGFDVSRDGCLVCSASAGGETCFYDYHSARLVRKVKLSETACLSVAWHPTLPSITAVSDWNGAVHVLQ